MRVKSVGLSDVGKERQNNEDTLFIGDDLGLYIVCDGLGGHANGKVASESAVRSVVSYIRDHLSTIEPGDYSEKSCDSMISLVRHAVLFACKEVNSLAENNPENMGMCTTLTMLLVVGEKAVMGHVGDSRLYLKRRDRIHQISKDHTLVRRLLSEGILTPEAAATSPQKHVLTRVIGQYDSVQVDTLLFDLIPNDICLLCSDGLSGSLHETQELDDLLIMDEFDTLCEDLVALANERDGSDNISVLVIAAEEDSENRDAEQARADEVYLKIDSLKEVYLFEDLTLEEILHLIEMVRVVDCDAGDILIKEDEQSTSLYIIFMGACSVKRADTEIAILTQGNHFGEMALINDSPRSATVCATEPSRLLVLDKKAFLKLIEQEKAMGVKLLWRLASELSVRLSRANEQLAARQ